jgi:hypothetical protein
MMSLPDLLNRVRGLPDGADLRAYLRYLSRHPFDAVTRRPALTGTTPPYLEGLQHRPTPLKWMPPSDRRAIAEHDERAGVPRPNVDWNRSFLDPEDLSALHRFAWLLPWLLSNAASGRHRMELQTYVVTLALAWRQAFPQPSAHEAWQSYTISERLANWFWAGVVCGWPLNADGELAASIQIQADHLCQHLEYHGEILTGNHLSNNGRALYLTGIACGCSEWADAGRAILVNESRRLFDEDGFLREGSSHYQLLVTKNYSEALWLAQQCGDDEAVRTLSPVVNHLARASAFFLLTNEDGVLDIPRIGDISPDCTPGWLLGVPFVAGALTGTSLPRPGSSQAGWHLLFPQLTTGDRVADGEVAHARAEAPRSTREWARLDACEPWTVMAHVNPRGYPFRPGHAHQDSGGFVAYHGGEPVVLDAGRRRYTLEPENEWGKRAPGHSIAMVDTLDPAPEWHWAFARNFLAEHAGALPLMTVDGRDLTISHGGFARRSAVGHYSRTITAVDAQTLRVHDRIEGSATHRVQVVFHLAGAPAPGARLVVAGARRRCELSMPDGLAITTTCGGPGEQTYGWGCAEYGTAYPLTSVVASGAVVLPWSGITTLRVSP